MSIELKIGGLAVWCARRGSGKSTMMRYVVDQLLSGGQYEWVKVCCPTAHLNRDWDHIEAKHIRTTNLEKYIDNLYKRQADAKALANKNKERFTSRGVLILDDMVGAVGFNSQLWAKISTTGRHYGITTLFAVQYWKSIPPIIRTQADMVCVMGHLSDAVVKTIYEEYSPPNVKSERHLRAILNSATADYGALCIENSRGGKLYKMKVPADFRAPKIEQG